MSSVNRKSLIESLTEDYKSSVEMLFERMYESIYPEMDDNMNGIRPNCRVENYIMELFAEKYR